MSDTLPNPQALERIQIQREVTVHNERAKLFANACDRVSTAVLSMGILGPIASRLYGLGAPLPWDWLVAWFVIWVGVACVLHLGARGILGGMT
jgi:hypothetical protein